LPRVATLHAFGDDTEVVACGVDELRGNSRERHREPVLAGVERAVALRRQLVHVIRRAAHNR
jgi:hypothetical protein